MFSVESCAIPEDALLNKYVRDGTYTDCYKTDIYKSVTHAQYVTAFYTTLLFKLERVILKILVSKPSTDAQAEQLAMGSNEDFAAWRVEMRCNNQLLLCDYRKRTRSWLMVVALNDESEIQTRLYFGSAVVPVENSKLGKPALEFGFRALLGFHRLYSVALLYVARLRLEAQVP